MVFKEGQVKFEEYAIGERAGIISNNTISKLNKAGFRNWYYIFPEHECSRDAGIILAKRIQRNQAKSGAWWLRHGNVIDMNVEIDASVINFYP